MIFNLRKQAETIILSKGDIIIDRHNNSVCVLLNCVRRVDIEHDDLYFWEISWTAGDTNLSDLEDAGKHYFEEDGLKLSIVIGMYEWNPANENTNKIFTEK
tara:strand:+ start:276 stop:578 length:303 start_codon:yes stop_codon:yes gene_type:complete